MDKDIAETKLGTVLENPARTIRGFVLAITPETKVPITINEKLEANADYMMAIMCVN